MEHEIAFLINEKSGKGEAGNLAHAARTGLPGLRIQSTVPDSAFALTEMCRRLSPADTQAAVVFGGDGTLNYALRGLLENDVPLYPYPSGTANDLASENGITGSPEQLGRLVRSQSVRKVRILHVNGIPFSTISGIGIGSKVCDEFNKMRGRFRWIQMLPKRFNCEIYSLLATKAMFWNWGKGHLVRLISHDFNEVVHTSILMVCNQSTLAGNLRVAPGQTPNQETFTVLYHQDPCGATTLKALAKMKMGSLDPKFKSFQTKNLRIESLNGDPLQVFGDGEILTSSPILDFGIHPKKLSVFSEC